MILRIPIEQMRDRLEEAIAAAENGETVLITRDDADTLQLTADIAVFTSQQPKAGKRPLGLFAGTITITDDFDDPLDDFAEYQ